MRPRPAGDDVPPLTAVLAGAALLVTPTGDAGPAPAQIVARAPTGVTPAAERLLAASAEPRRLDLLPGDDALSLARRICGRLTDTYVRLLLEANQAAAKGQAVIPACFVTRLGQVVKVEDGETWSALANRTTGAAGSKTLSAMIGSSRTVSDADAASIGASAIPSHISAVTVPVSTEPVAYRPRPGVDADRLADDLRAALNAPPTLPSVPTQIDQFTLEAGVDASLKAGAVCASNTARIEKWPFDVSDAAAVLGRNRARFGDGTPTVVGVVDNGIDGVATPAFPLDEFAVNQLELAHPSDNIDEDGDGFADDVVGTNIYEGGAPAAMAGSAYPAHGSMMASLALGGSEFRAWRREAGFPIAVKLRVVSIVKRAVVPSAQGKLTTYSMPTEALGRAISYVDGVGASIINLSVSTPTMLQEVSDALYNRSNLLLVVAAGNSATDLDATNRYPAAYSRDVSGRGRVITVAAHDARGCLSGFSGRGKETVDLAAPGERIHAIGLAGQDVVDDGTSQATAITTFVAGQLRAAGLTRAAAIKERLLASVDLEPAFRDLVRSEGRLDVSKALSIGDDVLDIDPAGSRIYGQLSKRLVATDVCPSLPTDAGDVLKVSRRIDDGATGEVRVLLRRRASRGDVETLHCRPAEQPMTITEAGGRTTTFRLIDVVDLVPAV